MWDPCHLVELEEHNTSYQILFYIYSSWERKKFVLDGCYAVLINLLKLFLERVLSSVSISPWQILGMMANVVPMVAVTMESVFSASVCVSRLTLEKTVRKVR